MPNRGGLIKTDSVRHFFDIMEIDSFFLMEFFLSNAVLIIACSCNAPKRGYGQKADFGNLPVKRHLKTKKDFCGNHCRKSPMRSIDDGGPAALHNASDQARCNPATLYPASKNDH